MAEQLEDGTQGKGKGGGGMGFVIGLVVATLVAAGAGAGLGFLLGPNLATPKQQEQPKKEEKEGEKKETGFKPRYTAPGTVVRLKPIIANLRAPFRSWARLEAAMLVSKEAEEDKEKAQAVETLKAVVEQDITAWLRTLALKDLEGPSNLTFLHDDLTERARIRSKGLVREIIILTLVVE
jgi:flagellar FliL protein